MIFSIKVHAFTVFCCSFIYSFFLLHCCSYLKSSSNLASLPFSHFRDTRAALFYTQLCFTSISGYCSFNPGSQYYIGDEVNGHGNSWEDVRIRSSERSLDYLHGTLTVLLSSKWHHRRGQDESSVSYCVWAPTYQLLRGLLQPQTPLNASFDDVKAKLGEHFSPKPSSIVQRYTFHTRLRHQQESVADYVAALRAIGEHCEFGDSLNDMIRDRLVCGINNSRIQTRLLQEQDRLTYELAIKTAQTMELASQNAQDLSKQLSSAPVNQMKHQREQHKPQKDIECYRCGGSHYATHCRFKDVDCRRCGKKGHLAKVCHSSKKEDHNNQTHQNPRSVNKTLFKTLFKYNAHSLDHKPNPHHSATVPEEDSQSTDYPLFTLPGNVQPIVLTMEVNGSDLSMELDTGASLSLISEQTYTNMSHALPPLTQSNVVLSTYTGEKIRPIGTVDVTVRYNCQQVTVPLLVIPGQGPGLVGRNWLEKIKLNWSDLKVVNVFSSIDDIIQKHKEVFCPKLGKLKDIGAKLHVDLVSIVHGRYLIHSGTK